MNAGLLKFLNEYNNSHLDQLQSATSSIIRATNTIPNRHTLMHSIKKYPLPIRCGAAILPLEGGTEEGAMTIQRLFFNRAIIEQGRRRLDNMKQHNTNNSCEGAADECYGSDSGYENGSLLSWFHSSVPVNNKTNTTAKRHNGSTSACRQQPQASSLSQQCVGDDSTRTLGPPAVPTTSRSIDCNNNHNYQYDNNPAITDMKSSSRNEPFGFSVGTRDQRGSDTPSLSVTHSTSIGQRGVSLPETSFLFSEIEMPIIDEATNMSPIIATEAKHRTMETQITEISSSGGSVSPESVHVDHRAGSVGEEIGRVAQSPAPYRQAHECNTTHMRKSSHSLEMHHCSPEKCMMESDIMIVSTCRRSVSQIINTLQSSQGHRSGSIGGEKEQSASPCSASSRQLTYSLIPSSLPSLTAEADSPFALRLFDGDNPDFGLFSGAASFSKNRDKVTVTNKEHTTNNRKRERSPLQEERQQTITAASESRTIIPLKLTDDTSPTTDTSAPCGQKTCDPLFQRNPTPPVAERDRRNRDETHIDKLPNNPNIQRVDYNSEARIDFDTSITNELIACSTVPLEEYLTHDDKRHLMHFEEELLGTSSKKNNKITVADLKDKCAFHRLLTTGGKILLVKRLLAHRIQNLVTKYGTRSPQKSPSTTQCNNTIINSTKEAPLTSNARLQRIDPINYYSQVLGSTDIISNINSTSLRNNKGLPSVLSPAPQCTAFPFKLIVDHRERTTKAHASFAQWIRQQTIETVNAMGTTESAMVDCLDLQLPCGDFMFSLTSGNGDYSDTDPPTLPCIVERKTLADLAGSLATSHYSAQKRLMRAVGFPFLFLIIEGDLSSYGYGHVPRSASGHYNKDSGPDGPSVLTPEMLKRVQSGILTTSIIDGISVLHAHSKAQTLQLLVAIGNALVAWWASSVKTRGEVLKACDNNDMTPPAHSTVMSGGPLVDGCHSTIAPPRLSDVCRQITAIRNIIQIKSVYPCMLATVHGCSGEVASVLARHYTSMGDMGRAVQAATRDPAKELEFVKVVQAAKNGSKEGVELSIILLRLFGMEIYD